MSKIPRPRHPEEPTPPFNFEEVNNERLREMGELLTRIVQQKDITNMRDKILELYFREEA